MRRDRIFCCLVVWLAFSSFCAAHPLPEGGASSSDPAFQIGLETWFSTGESSWEISFREFIPELGTVRGRSLLEWEDLDSVVYRLHAEYRFNALFRVAGSYGFGRIQDGDNTDTDWVRLDEQGEFMLMQSVADTRGDIALLDINAYFRLNEWIPMTRVQGDWDVLIGYRYYEEDMRDRHGVLTVLLEERISEPFPGLDSTYLFKWSALRLGVRGRVALTEQVRAQAELAGLFGIRFEGEGFWNLREDFRNKSPNFVQEASAGTGAEIKASLAYDFTPSFYGEIGFWWFRMQAKNGTDTTFFSDGTTGAASLDSVKTTRHGVFLGLGGRF